MRNWIARWRTRSAIVSLVISVLVCSISVFVPGEAASGSTTAEASAIAWASARVGTNVDSSLCLAFAVDAWRFAGVNIRSHSYVKTSIGADTYPETVWQGGFSHGTSGGPNTTPPPGALVFFDAKPGYPITDSHVMISLGGGNNVSTADAYNEKSVHDETLTQEAASGAYSTYVGWWLPDGALTTVNEVEVPLHVCPTTGYSNGAKQPTSILTVLSASLRGKMTAWISSFGSGVVLAPSGWGCSAVVGGDGGTIVNIFDDSDPIQRIQTSQSFGVGPMFWLACPFLTPFPYPQEALGEGPCPESLPSFESEVRVGASEATFTIPAGDGGLSSAVDSVGGTIPVPYSVFGAVAYRPNTDTGSGSVACTMLPSKADVCRAIVTAFLNWYR